VSLHFLNRHCLPELIVTQVEKRMELAILESRTLFDAYVTRHLPDAISALDVKQAALATKARPSSPLTSLLLATHMLSVRIP
jgi:hypothetical protein